MDSMAGCSLLRFLDCYSGYHQILLKEEDQIKTSFITLFNAFCYTTMSFRLKSAGALYQRGIQRCLQTQLRCNAKAYVDDVVVKTWEDKELITLTSSNPVTRNPIFHKSRIKITIIMTG
jgi:hypothetical protein